LAAALELDRGSGGRCRLVSTFIEPISFQPVSDLAALTADKNKGTIPAGRFLLLF
jgi:hypothetical protein